MAQCCREDDSNFVTHYRSSSDPSSNVSQLYDDLYPDRTIDLYPEKAFRKARANKHRHMKERGRRSSKDADEQTPATKDEDLYGLDPKEQIFPKKGAEPSTCSCGNSVNVLRREAMIHHLQSEIYHLQKRKEEVERKNKELQTTVLAMAFKFEALTKAVECLAPQEIDLCSRIEDAASRWTEGREDTNGVHLDLDGSSKSVGLQIANDVLTREKLTMLHRMDTLRTMVETAATSMEREWWMLVSRTEETLQQLSSDIPESSRDLSFLLEDVREAAESSSSFVEAISRKVQQFATTCETSPRMGTSISRGFRNGQGISNVPCSGDSGSISTPRLRTSTSVTDI